MQKVQGSNDKQTKSPMQREWVLPYVRMCKSIYMKVKCHESQSGIVLPYA